MVKYNVYWTNAELPNDRIKNEFIDSYDTYDEAFQSIRDWWDKNSFYPNFIRIIGDIEEQGTITIDYGPYFKFYQIKKEEVNE